MRILFYGFHLLELLKMSRVKAPIWDYFKIVADDEKYCICSVCSKRVSRGGKTVKTFNTSNMIDHIRKKHTNDYKDYESKKKIQKIKKSQVITDKQTATKGRQQLAYPVRNTSVSKIMGY